MISTTLLLWILGGIIYIVLGIGAAKLVCAYNDDYNEMGEHAFILLIWPLALIISAFINFEKKR